MRRTPAILAYGSVLLFLSYACSPGTDVDSSQSGDDSGDGDSALGPIEEGTPNDGLLCVGDYREGKVNRRCREELLVAATPLSIHISRGYPGSNEPLEFGCTATVADGRILVESWISSRASGGGDGDITLVANAYAECETEPLPAGEYTIVHGDESFKVQVGDTNAQLCDNSHSQKTCCLTKADCGDDIGMECRQNECQRMACTTAADCPTGGKCAQQKCIACECDEGFVCHPQDGGCVSATPTGPGYSTCESDDDCGGLFERCISDVGICAASCAEATECPAVPDGSNVQCHDYDGLTNGKQCLLACSDDVECPAGLVCRNGLFCSDGPALSGTPDDGPCTTLTPDTEATCTRTVGRYYGCSCRTGLSDPDSNGAAVGSSIAASCAEALDDFSCGD